MTVNLGNFSSGQTIYDLFTTFNPASGAPYTLAGTPILRVYKNNIVTPWGTDISVGNGTLTIDLNSIVGLNAWNINMGADGTFFAAGNEFSLVVAQGTINGVSAIGTRIARWSVVNRNTNADLQTIKGQAVTCSGGVTIPADTLASVSNITGAALSSAGIDAILDRAALGTYTTRQCLQAFMAVLVAKCSGGGTTTITFRDINDTKNAIVSNVDTSGNRSTITLNL